MGICDGLDESRGERRSCLRLPGFWYVYLEVPFSDIENTEMTRFSGAKSRV